MRAAFQVPLRNRISLKRCSIIRRAKRFAFCLSDCLFIVRRHHTSALTTFTMWAQRTA
jgi:hypothetical protein